MLPPDHTHQGPPGREVQLRICKWFGDDLPRPALPGRRSSQVCRSSPQIGIRFALAMAEVADGDTTRVHEPLIRLWEDQTSALGRGLLHTAPGRTDAAFQAFRDVKSWPPAALVLTLRDWYPSLFAPFRADSVGAGMLPAHTARPQVGCPVRPDHWRINGGTPSQRRAVTVAAAAGHSEATSQGTGAELVGVRTSLPSAS